MNNPLISLPAEIRDSCVLGVVPASGTIKDWSVTGATISTSGTPTWCRDGNRFAICTDSGHLFAAANSAFDISTLSLFTACPYRELTGGFLMRKLNDNFRFYFSIADRIQIWNGSVSSTVFPANSVGKNSFACSVVSGSAPLFYQDGVYLGAGSASLTIPTVSSNLSLGASASLSPKAPFGCWAMFNRVLTSTEMSTLHDWSQQRFTPLKTWKGWDIPSRVVPLEPGCVGAWDFRDLSGGQLPDRSGNGNTGTVMGNVQKVKTEVGEAGWFDGSSGYVDLGTGVLDTTSSDFTLELTVKLNNPSPAENTPLFGSGVVGGWSSWSSGGLTQAIGATTLTYTHFKTVGGSGYINSYFPALGVGTPHMVVVTYSQTTKELKRYLDGVYLGVETAEAPSSTGKWGIATSFSNQSLFDSLSDATFVSARVFGAVKTEAQVEEDYKEFASKPTFVSQEASSLVSLANETGGNLSNTPWKIDSGSWKVVDDVAVEGGRAIECVNAGLLYTESLHAYGTWEFDLRPATVNPQVTLFGDKIAGTSNSYDFNRQSSSDYFQLVRRSTTSIVTRSVDSVALDSAWYRVRITRRYDGQWTVYVDGDLMTPNGGYTNPVTDNTHTASKYTVLDFDAGDRIANFRHYPGVIAP